MFAPSSSFDFSFSVVFYFHSFSLQGFIYMYSFCGYFFLFRANTRKQFIDISTCTYWCSVHDISPVHFHVTFHAFWLTDISKSWTVGRCINILSSSVNKKEKKIYRCTYIYISRFEFSRVFFFFFPILFHLYCTGKKEIFWESVNFTWHSIQKFQIFHV